MRLGTIAWPCLWCVFTASCSRPPTHAGVVALTPPSVQHPDHPNEAAEFYRQERAIGDDQVPAERYLEAMRHVRTMRRYSIGSSRFVDELPRGAATGMGPWTSLGPGNIGGRTRALLIDPNNPNVMYAGGATGGVWKTTDAGQSWNPQTDFAPVLVLNTLAMSSADSNTLYAGTGEQTQGWRGAGIFKTTDGGNTWNQLPSTANSNFYFTGKIAISNNDQSHVYAATASGLWSSPDAGSTWTKVLTTGGSGCFDLAVQPGQATDVVLAVCQPSGASNYAIYRNTDAAGKGAWNSVFSDSNMSVATLAIAPSRPTTIYAVANPLSSTTYSGALLAVYRSQSSGDPGTWTVQTSNTNPSRLDSGILSGDAFYSFPNPFCDPTKTPSFTGQGSYNLVAAVDPLDPNRLWAGGINLFRSDDGGVTWGYAGGTPWYTPTNENHPDQHALAFPPNYDGDKNQTLYSGNDGGIFITNQARGKTGTCASPSYTVFWNSINNYYTATQFYHGVPYPGGGAYFGGTQDNGTVLGTDSGGPNQWNFIFIGDGGVSRLDPIDSTILFTEYVGLYLLRSTDGGFNYSQVIKGITEPTGHFQFITYYTFDPNNSLRMYIGGWQLWRTEDGANSWTAASPATLPVSGTNSSSISAIAVSPADPNFVVFGSTHGEIYRNYNALASDSKTGWPTALPRLGTVKHLEFDPNNPNTIYATYTTFKNSATDNHIYRSTDRGVTWTGIDGSGPSGLPDVPVDTIVVDPDNSTHLYAGTDLGLFVSLDNGATWANDDNPFPNTMAYNLVIDKTGGAKNLFVFTYGRGAWRVPMSGGPSTCTYNVAPNAAIDVTGGTASVDVTTQPGCGWSVLAAKSSNTTGIAVQAPGSGSGPGKAFFTVSPNVATTPRSATFSIMGQTVTITQAGAAVASIGDEPSTAQSIPSFPYMNSASNALLTNNTADPQHSCSGSQDFKTGWYVFTAPSNMGVQAGAQGFAASGDVGTVLTAYSYDNKTVGAELGCVVIPKKAGAHTYGSISFAAAAGKTYVIEVSVQSASAAAAPSAAYYLSVIAAPPGPTNDITPPAATLLTGATQQFTVKIGNQLNTAVRWTVSPNLGFVTPAGLYTAPALVDSPTTVKVIATSLANPALNNYAVVTVTPPPLSVAQGAVVNAASFQGGAVSPGEVVTVFGTSIGPAILQTAQLDSQGKVASTLAGTQVLFDNVAAPLVYSYATQVSAIVPYEVAGKATTQMVVTRNGQRSVPQTLSVTGTAPAFFTALSNGSGSGAVLNFDNLWNATYPAPRGTQVTLFGTGEGVTNPPSVTGGVNTTVYPKPAAPYSVKIGGVDAEILYFGAAPTEVAGVLQVNLKVPTTVAPGPQPVVMTIGGVQSRSDVTLNVLGPDGRTGAPGYRNTGSAPVTIAVSKPDSPNTPIPVGTIQPGSPNTVFIFTNSTVQSGNDWWISVNGGLPRIISQVCDYTISTTFGPYWGCSGNADQPFPR